MTAESAGTADAGAETDPGPWLTALRALDADSAVVGVGAVSLLAVGARVTMRVLRNLPFDPLVVPPSLRATVVGATPVVLSLSLVAVAVAARRPAVRVGLLFAGVFGLLATVDRAATLPAVAAATGGGALAVGGAVGRPTTYREFRRAAVGAVLVAAVAVSLASAAGALDGSHRATGSLLALLGVAAVGVRAGDDLVGLLAGAVALVAVAAASVNAPFVAGSAFLVGFAVVGVPHGLVALAAAGGVAAVVAGLRRRRPALAVGAALLLLAGVPATLPRASAVLLGATLALTERTSAAEGSP